MATLKGKNYLTEKGALKPVVRDGLTENVKNHLMKGYSGCQVVEDKPKYLVVEHYNENGETIAYTHIELTTSLKHPSELAERKSSPKKSTKAETFEID